MATYLEKLFAKATNVAESTRKGYIGTLLRLNGKQPVKNLKYLDDYERIFALMATKARNTQKTMITPILKALSLTGKLEGPLYKIYKARFDEIFEENNKITESNMKTPKQEANWISQEDVEKKMAELLRKEPTSEQTMILALYTYQAPRRNADYMNMSVIHEMGDEEKMDDTRNYFDMTNHNFIFNDYKTKYGMGQQIIPIDIELYKILLDNLKADPREILIPQKNMNHITNVLNKIFSPKRIGSTMLRHIYLSSKYSRTVEERKKDAFQMGHGIKTQADYIKH
jgi:hypothetical protein